MIFKLDHTKNKNAHIIKDLFYASYTVEAKILGVTYFPPLSRTISQFISSNSFFYAYCVNNNIVGLIEVNSKHDVVHIQSLVVDPEYFRQGIARKLIHFIFNMYKFSSFTVDTGVKNYPAVSLYLNLGFEESERWDTDHGVRKVKFKRLSSK